MTTSSEKHRKEQADRLAAQLGINGEALFRGAVAAWSNLNPQTVSFDRALSVAAAVLAPDAPPMCPDEGCVPRWLGPPQRCTGCGAEVREVEHACRTTHFEDKQGSWDCETRYDDCGACQDGERHPHWVDNPDMVISFSVVHWYEVPVRSADLGELVSPLPVSALIGPTEDNYPVADHDEADEMQVAVEEFLEGLAAKNGPVSSDGFEISRIEPADSHHSEQGTS